MNENEMSQQERDAAEVERMRILKEAIEVGATMTYEDMGDWFRLCDQYKEDAPAGLYAALRLIKSQATEIARLRAACEGVPEILDEALKEFGDYYGYTDYPDDMQARLRAKAAELRVALSADAATPADGNGNEVAE